MVVKSEQVTVFAIKITGHKKERAIFTLFYSYLCHDFILITQMALVRVFVLVNIHIQGTSKPTMKIKEDSESNPESLANDFQATTFPCFNSSLLPV